MQANGDLHILVHWCGNASPVLRHKVLEKIDHNKFFWSKSSWERIIVRMWNVQTDLPCRKMLSHEPHAFSFPAQKSSVIVPQFEWDKWVWV